MQLRLRLVILGSQGCAGASKRPQLYLSRWFVCWKREREKKGGASDQSRD